MSTAMNMAIETDELSKRYQRVSALTECTISVPQGRVCALVGPNGAGKTTLLRMLAGLASPSGGTARVLGGAPRQHPAFLADIGFLAQEIPLYRRFTAEDHIRIGTHLNPRWDAALVRNRLAELRVPLDQRVGTLSGGQRAQVALALTLAKRPWLLLLDEPVAALDPLARRNFLATLISAVADAEGALTVVLSSHLVTDLERVCDHLILLTGSRVQLCGDIGALLAEHKDVAFEDLVLAYLGTDEGFQIASHWHSMLAACSGLSTCLRQQPPLVSQAVVDALFAIGMTVPAVLGALWGAPIVAHELESRTSDFAWSQSVTRTRWLTTKAGWLLLAAATCGGHVRHHPPEGRVVSWATWRYPPGPMWGFVLPCRLTEG